MTATDQQVRSRRFYSRVALLPNRYRGERSRTFPLRTSRGVRLIRFSHVICAVVLSCAASCCVWAQGIEVGLRVPISPPRSGWHNWTIIEADPNDSHHLIACGDKWSPETNSLSGFLYASFDGGRSWQLKVVDTTTSWVSEESCAFGPDGRAYFIADASKVFDGQPHHRLGQTHMYHSDDAGRRWSSPTVWARWTDHNALVVDNTTRPYRGTVYLFYNTFQDWRGEASEQAQHSDIRLYPLYSRDIRKSSGGPVGKATTVGLPGTIHPISARVLSNDSVIALFLATRTGDSVTDSIEVLTTEARAKALSPLTQIMRVAPIPGAKCTSYPAMAVDDSDGPFRGRIYVMGVDASSGSCRILISNSSDNGKTWSRPVPVNIANESPSKSVSNGQFIFTMGVNRRGVIGLAWTEMGGACWRFSASTDGGIAFLPSVPLSDCPPNQVSSLHSLNYYMQAHAGDGRDGANTLDSSSAAFSLRAGTGYVWRTSMAVTPDGVFHPVWMQNEEGGGQIWTASVGVGEDPDGEIIPALLQLEDVSSQVTFAFANNHYDEVSGTVSVDVGVINKTNAKTTLKAPLFMQVTDLHSDFGAIEVENADNAQRGVGAIWDLSNLLPIQALEPGAVSDRRALLFRISNPKLPPRLLADLVVVRARVFGKPVSKK